MKARIVILLSASVLLCLSAQAGITTNYGDYVASTVRYLQVWEDTDAGAYRAPKVTGDTMNFDPIGLGVTATGGGVDFNDAQLSFFVDAKNNRYINELQFSELGDYTLLGAGTAGTYVDVSATFFVNIFEVDGVDIDPLSITNTMTFSPNASGTFALPTDAGNGKLWSGNINLNIDAMLADNGVDFVNGATLISVNLDNLMVAFSESGTIASLKKKDVNGFSVTTVPEPASLVLLVGTSSLIAFIRRRFFI